MMRFLETVLASIRAQLSSNRSASDIGRALRVLVVTELQTQVGSSEALLAVHRYLATTPHNSRAIDDFDEFLVHLRNSIQDEDNSSNEEPDTWIRQEMPDEDILPQHDDVPPPILSTATLSGISHVVQLLKACRKDIDDIAKEGERSL